MTSGHVRRRASGPLVVLAALVVFLAACSDDAAEERSGSAATDVQSPVEAAEPAATTLVLEDDVPADSGVRLISVEQAAAILFEDPPAGLVVLDLRTANEFNGRRLPGAVLLDYNSPDFEERVAELDRDVPYLIYDRAGNRGAAARDVMTELGFSDVADIDGGISAWTAAGYFG